MVPLLATLDKLTAWFYPFHYTIVEIKMVAVMEWGKGPIEYETLGQKNLELKLAFCDELEKIIEVIEGSMSRTKGFILLSCLRTLDFMKQKDIPIAQVKKNLIHFNY